MLGNLLRTLLSPRGRPASGLPQALRLYETGNPGAAELMCEQVLAHRPSEIDALALLALCQEALGQGIPSRASWGRVLALDPDHPEALCAAGEVVRATGLTRGEGESEQSFAQRLRTAQQLVTTWGQQDRLWRHGVAREPRIPLPVWDGGRLDGMRILLHSLRGLGDTLNFARYAARLAERGARIRMECAAPLHSLLGRGPGVAEVVESGAPLAARGCDVHAPLVVLLKHFFFADLIREQRAYLTADAARAAAWGKRLAQARGLRVGLCWAGDPSHKNDARRSMTLAALEPLLKRPGVRWVSLQKGDAARQAMPSVGATVDDWTAELFDFGETAALIANLDLVISVNTAVAHLAGALGKRVWILYSEDEDRRWEIVHDARSVYADARVFRRQAGDWSTAVDALGRALDAQLARE